MLSALELPWWPLPAVGCQSKRTQARVAGSQGLQYWPSIWARQGTSLERNMEDYVVLSLGLNVDREQLPQLRREAKILLRTTTPL